MNNKRKRKEEGDESPNLFSSDDSAIGLVLFVSFLLLFLTFHAVNPQKRRRKEEEEEQDPPHSPDLGDGEDEESESKTQPNGLFSFFSLDVPRY